jgi:endonuclease/exonuclease/phosphatase family metal-dependent hydrolase
MQKDYRHPMIIQEVENASVKINDKMILPGIILFQEMDMLEDIHDKLNAMSKDIYGDFEYSYEFIAKGGEYHNDGLCVFYDNKQYRSIEVNKGHYTGPMGDMISRRCYLQVLLEHVESKKKIVVCTLHLKAKRPNRKLRALEIVEYLNRLNGFILKCKEDGVISKEDAKSLPVIVAGDFNDEPDSPVIGAMFDPDMTHGLKFKCAYQVDGEFPEYTTYKYREGGDTLQKGELIKHTIDYIFHNEYTKLKSIQEMPKEEDIPEMGHPSYRC